MLSEYIRHRVIGSPLEPLANQLRGHRIRRHCRRSPEIAEALAESLYFDEIFAEQITDGMNCIDAGAHIGSVLSAFRRLSPRGHHIAIEPTPYKARWLRRRFGKTRIEEVALASEPRTATFYHFPRNSAFSGLRVQRSGAKARGGGGGCDPWATGVPGAVRSPRRHRRRPPLRLHEDGCRRR